MIRNDRFLMRTASGLFVIRYLDFGGLSADDALKIGHVVRTLGSPTFGLTHIEGTHRPPSKEFRTAFADVIGASQNVTAVANVLLVQGFVRSVTMSIITGIIQFGIRSHPIDVSTDEKQALDFLESHGAPRARVDELMRALQAEG